MQHAKDQFYSPKMESIVMKIVRGLTKINDFPQFILENKVICSFQHTQYA